MKLQNGIASSSFSNKINKEKQTKKKAFRLNKLSVCLGSALYTASAFGVPTGHVVSQGSASFDLQGSQLNITNSNGTVINWQDFSIANGEAVNFIQNSNSSAVLNRVTSDIPSQIQGQLNSNGRVFVINPNGVLIGQSAQIDVAGFVASTLNISDSDFAAGRYNFKGNSGKVENRGYITTAKGGEVVLIAPTIENSGVIKADGGEIVLAAGREVSLQSLENPDVSYTISAPGDSALNLGQLLASNGSVKVFADSIKNQGVISATRAVQSADGSIHLEAASDISVSGTLDASGSGADGGKINVLGSEVNVVNANIDASGDNGGEILIGGDYQGQGSVKNAANTNVDASTNINANAGVNGNGGKVIVWSDGKTESYATITAKGGSTSGDGGFVETSGKRELLFGAPADVSATNGEAGTWLLDPEDIVIGDSEAASISTALNGGSNVEVKTSDAGDGEGNISVNSDITKTEGDDGVTLTLDAHNRVDVNASISSTAGALNVNIKTGRTVATTAEGPDTASTTSGESVPSAVPETSAPESSTPALDSELVIASGDTEVADFIDQSINQVVITENISTAGGSVSIHAGEQGDAIISSEITTTALESAVDQSSGDITIEANRIALTDDAKLDASGEQAGDILVGGDVKGQNEDVQNAEFTYVSDDAQIKSDGGKNGDGGKVIVFASDTATVNGTITAKGGTESGNGGFIETSGLKGLTVKNAPDASASNGESGEWLIDPYNITIGGSDGAISGTSSPFTATGTSATLSFTTLLTALEAGNVTVDTTSAVGAENGDIELVGNLDFEFSTTATNSHTLTLNADRDITLLGSIYNSITTVSADPRLGNLNLNAGRNVNFNGDEFDVTGFHVNVAGDINVASTANNVVFEPYYGGTITATNLIIGASSTDRVSGEVSFDPGRTYGGDLIINTSTTSIFADGDVVVDSVGISDSVEINSSFSQNVYADRIIVNAGDNSGIGEFTGFASDGPQTFNATTDINLQALGAGNATINSTSLTSQTINAGGKLRLQNGATGLASIQDTGVQTINTGVGSAAPTSIELVGVDGNEALIAAGTININTNGGVLNLDGGKIESTTNAGTATVGDFEFANGSEINLNGGTLTINGGPVGSNITGTGGTNEIDNTTVNFNGTNAINKNSAATLELTNTVFNNAQTFNWTSGTIDLSSSSELNNSGTLNWSGGGLSLNSSSELNNSGTLNWTGSGGISTFSSASISNTGTINSSSTGGVFGDGGEAFDNSGTFIQSAGSTDLTGVNITNSGNFTVNSGAAVEVAVFGYDSFTQTAGTTTIDGTLTAPNGVTFNGGSVGGSGTFELIDNSVSFPTPSTLTATNTTFTPGNSVGTLTIDGNLDLSGGGNTIEIEADSATSFDKIIVNDNIMMPSTNDVNVTFTDGYTGPVNIGDIDTLTGVITAPNSPSSPVNPTVNPGGDAGLTTTSTTTAASLDITYTRTAAIPVASVEGVETPAVVVSTPTEPVEVTAPEVTPEDDDLILVFLITSEEESDLVGEGDDNEDTDKKLALKSDDGEGKTKDKEKSTKMCLAV